MIFFSSSLVSSLDVRFVRDIFFSVLSLSLSLLFCWNFIDFKKGEERACDLCIEESTLIRVV